MCNIDPLPNESTQEYLARKEADRKISGRIYHGMTMDKFEMMATARHVGKDEAKPFGLKSLAEQIELAESRLSNIAKDLATILNRVMPVEPANTPDLPNAKQDGQVGLYGSIHTTGCAVKDQISKIEALVVDLENLVDG